MTSPLEFESSWSLGERAYQAILEDLRSIDARSIVEFGSGTSTLRLSRDLPKANILSIEGDRSFFDETRRNLELHGGPANVELIHRPLCWQRHGLSWFRSYELGDFPERVDAVLERVSEQYTRRAHWTNTADSVIQTTKRLLRSVERSRQLDRKGKGSAMAETPLRDGGKCD